MDIQLNGDFRSPECIKILKEANIVVTNPPFSLFREYVTQLIEYEKKFLIMGNVNAITYKEIFPLIKDGRIWAGHYFNKTMEFQLSDHYTKWDRVDEAGNKYGKGPGIMWFTNLPVKKRADPLILYKTYEGHKKEYPKYDNYDAIEVNKIKNIPVDYYGVMGVPITFLGSYCSEQFEIVGSFNAGVHGKEVGARKVPIEIKGKTVLWNGPVINGNPLYKRLLIKRKK